MLGSADVFGSVEVGSEDDGSEEIVQGHGVSVGMCKSVRLDVECFKSIATATTKIKRRRHDNDK